MCLHGLSDGRHTALQVAFEHLDEPASTDHLPAGWLPEAHRLGHVVRAWRSAPELQLPNSLPSPTPVCQDCSWGGGVRAETIHGIRTCKLPQMHSIQNQTSG